MGEPDEPLRGFSWRSGTKRDTTGIIMWSDVFLHTIDRTGEKIAIFVMDTQGLFDNDSTAESNSKIFALGTLIPSIQILNIKGIIQENQLEYLQFATEYAVRSAVDNVGSSSFQSLMFLMRDWDNNDEYEYGIDGGSEYLTEILRPRHNDNENLQSVRQSISNCFNQTRCCLLPHPGKTVTSTKTYDGRWSEMDIEFKDQLKAVIENILIPKTMIVKKINSKEVIGKEMKDYIQNYFEIFQSNNTMKVLSIYDSTIVLDMKNIIEKCLNDYEMRMFENKDLFGNNKLKVHESCKEEVLKMYEMERKMGSIEFMQTCKTTLSEKIDVSYNKIEYMIKYEKAKFDAALEKEKQEKQELEQTIEYIKSVIERMKENPSAEGYKEIMEVLESRLEEEVKRLVEIMKKDNEKKEFRKKLRNAAISIFAGGIIGWFSKDFKPTDVVNMIGKAKNVITTVKAPEIVENLASTAASKINETITTVAKVPTNIVPPDPTGSFPDPIVLDPNLVGVTLLSIAVNGVFLTAVSLLAAIVIKKTLEKGPNN